MEKLEIEKNVVNKKTLRKNQPRGLGVTENDSMILIGVIA